MSDFYEKMLKNGTGRKVLQSVGLPTPVELTRYTGQAVFFHGNILIGASKNATLLNQLSKTLIDAKATTFFPANSKYANHIKRALEHHGQTPIQTNCEKGAVSEKLDVLVFDATGFEKTKDLKELYNFFSPVIKSLNSNGRILILGKPHMASTSAEQAACMRSLEGFSRSLAKEIGKKGATAQVIYVEDGAEHLSSSAIRFVLSPKSAYVDGQVINVSKADKEISIDWRRPLANKTALVTGGSRGIGESIASVLARDGAKVYVLDIEATKADLEKVAKEIGGVALVGDITAKETPEMIADAVKQNGGLDIIVHNAGIT